MLSSVFYKHGMFCTEHPWEVIMAVVTLTTMMTSITFFGDLSHSKVCGWNYDCPQAEVSNKIITTGGTELRKWILPRDRDDVQSSDIIILSIARCLAVAYIYLQFRKLGELGSKYILGLAGLSSIFFSVAFSSGFVHLLGYELHGLGDSLPFFLLVLDLSKVTTLARYALVTASDDVSIRETVARGVAILGPTLTLDTLVEVLVIGIGGFSGIPVLELVCCFGCVSLIVNYVVFMTFFPGSLCLVLELARNQHFGFVPKLKKHELRSESSPVAHRVKLIMSAGLGLVHVYSRWTHVALTPLELQDTLMHEQARRIVPDMPLWEFYLRGLFEFTPQQLVTYGFLVLICLKYVLYDSKSMPKLKKSTAPSTNGIVSNGTLSNGVSPKQQPVKSADNPDCVRRQAKQHLSCQRRRTFTVGEDDDEIADEVAVSNEFQKKIIPARPISTLGDAVPSDMHLRPKSIETSVVAPRKDKKSGYQALSDDEILQLVASKQITAHKLEEELGDPVRAIQIRRMSISSSLANPEALVDVPFKEYDYSYVNGTCCENVLGYIPVPLGYAGPLLVDGISYEVPLATTEGCLVASIHRGCKAVTLSGGVRTTVKDVGMTRGPVVKMRGVEEVDQLEKWIAGEGFDVMKKAFERTSRFAKLQDVQTRASGKLLYLRFRATTGDAMGMNMLCKGTEAALAAAKERFPDMFVLALSGNYCIDKKPSALNWIEGRGKSVNCEAVISERVLRDILKTSAERLVELSLAKNFYGSALAGSIGGNNAHAANAVGAIFLATGQDIAQTVGSSSCMTIIEASESEPGGIYISCTMPCMEVGTVGGGTILPPQAACLKALGVHGSNSERPGENSKRLASIICATVLAAELNLMSALAAGQLVQSHLKHNRSKLDVSGLGGSPAHGRSSSIPAVLPCSSSSAI